MKHTLVRDRRRGFTLMEILMVIAIIAILAAIVTVAIRTVISSARDAATKTTLKKIDASIYARLQNIDRYVFNDKKLRGAGAPRYMKDPVLLDMYNGRGTYAGAPNKPLADALAYKQFIRDCFPMTFAEAGIAAPPGHDPATENAECLYHFLTTAFVVGDGPPRALSLTGKETKDTDGDGLPEVVDAWGQPIRFYRWPTRLIRPQPAGSESVPQDETGAIAALDGWLMYYASLSPANNLGVDQYDEFAVLLAGRDAGYFTSQAFEDTYHTIETWNAPLLVSAGPDGQLGLFEPSDTARKGQLAQPDLLREWAMHDDIASWELSALGR